MKELLMSFVLSFATDYNVELPPIDFRIHTTPDSVWAYTVKHPHTWIITLDHSIKYLNENQIKSLVYNQVGQIAGMVKTTDKSFMNDRYCVTNFKRLKR